MVEQVGLRLIARAICFSVVLSLFGDDKDLFIAALSKTLPRPARRAGASVVGHETLEFLSRLLLRIERSSQHLGEGGCASGARFHPSTSNRPTARETFDRSRKLGIGRPSAVRKRNETGAARDLVVRKLVQAIRIRRCYSSCTGTLPPDHRPTVSGSCDIGSAISAQALRKPPGGRLTVSAGRKLSCSSQSARGWLQIALEVSCACTRRLARPPDETVRGMSGFR